MSESANQTEARQTRRFTRERVHCTLSEGNLLDNMALSRETPERMGVPSADELMHYTQKVPPGWDGRYCSWKQYEKKVRRWMQTTDLATTKQGAAVAMRQYGAPAKVAENFRDVDLARENGADLLLKKLKSMFDDWAADAIFKDIRKLIKSRRRRSQTMREFIAEWEALKSHVEVEADFSFGGGVDSYFLLDACGLQDSEIATVLTQTQGSFDYEMVRKATVRLFPHHEATESVHYGDEEDDEDGQGEDNLLDEGSEVYEVDEEDQEEFEEAYYQFKKAVKQLRKFRPNGKFKKPYQYRPSAGVRRWNNAAPPQHVHFNRKPGRERHARRAFFGEDASQEGGGEMACYGERTNPIDRKTGKPMECRGCGSTAHLVRQCPKQRPQQAHVNTAESAASLDEEHASLAFGFYGVDDDDEEEGEEVPRQRRETRMTMQAESPPTTRWRRSRQQHARHAEHYEVVEDEPPDHHMITERVNTGGLQDAAGRHRPQVFNLEAEEEEVLEWCPTLDTLSF